MEYLTVSQLSKAIRNGWMKHHDKDLIRIFNKVFAPTASEPISRSVLFYPSTGLDLLTPIMLGLPYCTEFYFYELYPGRFFNEARLINDSISILKNINGVKIEQSNWLTEKDEHLIQLYYDDIERTIHWVHKDNKDFLNKDVMLKFYFHRGDSYGEGGSGQFWDSELFPKLVNMIPEEVKGLFITDGEPGGLLHHMKESSHEFKIPDIEGGSIGGIYYFGSMFNKSCLSI